MTNASALKLPGITPASTIKVRRMDFDFLDDTPEFWFDNNPVLTSFLSGLSVAFPPGERFFIDSVRHFQGHVTDPELKEQIRGFIGQEANHTKEHIAFNKFLDSHGYPASAMEEYARKRIGELQKRSTPEQNLARTAALEHFTAILAGALLENPEVFEKMSPATARLWAWHAVEEVEHRSVAFDVYKLAVNDEKLRIRTMIITTVFFILINGIRTLMLLKQSGNLFNLRAWASGMNLLWGRKGVFWKVIPQYFAYYRRDFHPSQHDNQAEVDHVRRHWLGEKA